MITACLDGNCMSFLVMVVALGEVFDGELSPTGSVTLNGYDYDYHPNDNFPDTPYESGYKSGGNASKNLSTSAIF